MSCLLPDLEAGLSNTMLILLLFKKTIRMTREEWSDRSRVAETILCRLRFPFKSHSLDLIITSLIDINWLTINQMRMNFAVCDSSNDNNPGDDNFSLLKTHSLGWRCCWQDALTHCRRRSHEERKNIFHVDLYSLYVDLVDWVAVNSFVDRHQQPTSSTLFGTLPDTCFVVEVCQFNKSNQIFEVIGLFVRFIHNSYKQQTQISQQSCWESINTWQSWWTTLLSWIVWQGVWLQQPLHKGSHPKEKTSSWSKEWGLPSWQPTQITLISVLWIFNVMPSCESLVTSFALLTHGISM